MNVPLPGVTVDPQGVSTSVAITDSNGSTPTVYSDRFGVNTVALPDTITARTTFFLPGEGPWTITPTASGQITKVTTLTLEDSQVATVTVGSVFDASQWEQFGAYVPPNPTGRVTSVTEPAPIINAADAGIDLTGSSDSTTELQALCNTLAGLTYKPIIDFGAGGVKSQTITLTSRGYHFRGSYGGRAGADAGTELILQGTGALFQFGSDDGKPWDANSYSGYANQVFEDLYFTTQSQDTALANGQGSYQAGTYGVQAWRGGHIEFRGTCWMQGFEYGFWGIQSDYNSSERLMVEQCHRGYYLGPRSDQARLVLECNLNDVDFWVDGAMGYDVQFISVSGGCATGPIYPVVVGSYWSRMAQQGRIRPWLEQEQGYNSIQAFIGVAPHVAPGGPANYRADTAGTTSGSPTVTDTAITAADQGKCVSGPGIPAGSFVGTVTAGSSFLLSSSSTSQINVNATATAGGVTIHVGNDPTTFYADTYGNSTLHVANPNVLIGPQGATNSSKYLIEAGTNAGRIHVTDPGGPGMSNFAQTISFINASTADVLVESHHDYAATYVQNGTGSTNLTERTYASGQLYQRASLGRTWTEQLDRTHGLRDFYIESDSDVGGIPYFRIEFPNVNSGTGPTTQFLLTAPVQDGTAAPTTGAWPAGSYIRNTAPTVAGTAGSQYVTLGWVCTTAGTPGTWTPCRALTGT